MTTTITSSWRMTMLFFSVWLASCDSITQNQSESAAFARLAKWETAFDRSALLEAREVQVEHAEKGDLSVIEVKPDEEYQEMDGFGFTLNGGSAMLMMTQLSEKKR